MTHPPVGHSFLVRSSQDRWPDRADGRPPRNTAARPRPGAPAGPPPNPGRFFALAPLLALLVGVASFPAGPSTLR